MMIDNVIILAGGSGTRLWPASTRVMPKQFLDLTGEGSLLRQTVERAAATGMTGEIIIVTVEDQAAGIVKDLSGIADLSERIVVLPEPTARNTAPAIAFAVQYLAATNRTGGTSLILAADHVISPVDAFRDDVEKADGLARDGFLVTFGVAPTRPETGYGYLETGAEEGAGYRLKEFKEKPDRATAEVYVASARHYWNSGMFVFRDDRFQEELKRHEPAIYDGFAGMADSLAESAEAVAGADGIRRIEPDNNIRTTYQSLPKISFDYAVMERSDRTAMVPVSFAWNDVGSWDEVSKIERTAEPDEAAGAVVVEVESHENFVHSDLPVALCGVEGLHVIVKNGMVLVCRKGESQLVKNVVGTLQDRGRDDLL